MIHYYIERDGAVISEGYCPENELALVDRMGGTLVLETKLPKAAPPPEMGVLTQRQQLLSASDWTQLPDVPLATKEAWATYRQALRDITEQPGFPTQVAWPTPPYSFK